MTGWISKILSNKFPAAQVHIGKFQGSFPGIISWWSELQPAGSAEGSRHNETLFSHRPPQMQTFSLCPETMLLL